MTQIFRFNNMHQPIETISIPENINSKSFFKKYLIKRLSELQNISEEKATQLINKPKHKHCFLYHDQTQSFAILRNKNNVPEYITLSTS